MFTLKFRSAIAKFAAGVATLAVAAFPLVTATQAQAFTAPASLPKATSALAKDVMYFDSNRTGNFELFALNKAGGPALQITKDARYDSWFPRVSPDRRTVIFIRTPKGVHSNDYTKASLWAIASNGTGLTLLRPAGHNGWGMQGHPEWHPSGTAIVMFGTSGSSIALFRVNAVGQNPVKLTSTPGYHLDPMYSPDGNSIVFTGCPSGPCAEEKYDIYKMPAGGGSLTRITNDDKIDNDPTIAPDGTTIAWLTQFKSPSYKPWDIQIKKANGTVTRLVNDGTFVSRPNYGNDGWIYTHRVTPGSSKFDIYKIRPDGTGLTLLTKSQPGENEFPSP